MLDALPDWAPSGGAVAMLGAVVWMILTGKLVPGRTHDRIVADKDAQISEWRATAEKVGAQRDALLDAAHTTVKVVEAAADAATARGASP